MSTYKCPKSCLCSLFHLMCATARAHASTHGTSLMRVKNSMHNLCLWNEENERTEKSNLIVDHFSLTFLNLSLA